MGGLYQVVKRLTLLPISQISRNLIQRRRGEFDMAAPISLRGDFDGPMLRALVLAEKAGSVTRRLLSFVTIYDGGSRADADGLDGGKLAGHPSKLNGEQSRALVAMVEAGPTPAVHGVVRWRLIDLAQWVFDEYRISVTKQILSRELRALGYRNLSARPRHHAHDEAVVAAFKKKSRTSWRRSPRPAASHSNSGSKTKPASVRKTRSRDAGRNAARDLLP